MKEQENRKILENLKKNLQEKENAYAKSKNNLRFGLKEDLIIDESSFKKIIKRRKQEYDNAFKNYYFFFENCLRSEIIDGREGFGYASF